MRRADRQTYPALHRAWVRASDLDKAMAVLRAFSLPEVAALGETKRTVGSLCIFLFSSCSALLFCCLVVRILWSLCRVTVSTL